MYQGFDRVDQRLGNYRLTQRLGRGGFAEVYLAEHFYLKTLVAVKLLLTQLTQEAVETFRLEAQMIARLRHPSIVQVHDFGIENGTAYLVMDYAPHSTLRYQHPKGVQLSLPMIVSYAKQVAEALQYAHDQRLIHRDVKPENMLLGPRYEVLLSDFGIALTAHQSASLRTQDVAGTVSYMAPEQIQGRPRPASDQYSLATVVYEWLVGRRPFEGTWTEVALQQTIAPPPSLRQFLPTLSPVIEQVVMRALHKDPLQRFPSVRAFAQAFEQACQQSMPLPLASSPAASGLLAPASFMPPQQPTFSTAPTGPSGPSSPLPQTASAFAPPVTLGVQPPQRQVSRRVAVIGIAGLAATVAVSSGVTWLLTTQHQASSVGTPIASHDASAAATAPAGQTMASLAPATASLITYQGHTDDLMGIDWSPDGASLSTASQDGTAQVWASDSGKRFLSYSSQIIPAQSNDNALSVRWSHDGKRLAIGFADGTVQGIDAVSGKRLFTYSGGSAGINALAWSPDDAHLALASEDGTVQVYDVASGAMRTHFKGHLASVGAVVWSPKGKRIASGSDDTTVQVWDATTGQALLTFKEHARKVSSLSWSADDSQIASCSWDNTVMLWDAYSGRTQLTYTRHKAGWLNTVAWSRDGRYLASAGEVGTVTGNVYIGTRGTKDVNMHIWERQTGATTAIYQSLPVNALAWSPDGRRIATACTNNVAQVWRVL